MELRNYEQNQRVGQQQDRTSAHGTSAHGSFDHQQMGIIPVSATYHTNDTTHSTTSWSNRKMSGLQLVVQLVVRI